MEFKKKEIAKPYQVDKSIRGKDATHIDQTSIKSSIINGRLNGVYTKRDSSYLNYFLAFKVRFNMTSDFKRYHDMYIDVKLMRSAPDGMSTETCKNMFLGINNLNGTFNLKNDTISWFSNKDAEGYNPELSSLGRAARFYNIIDIDNAIDPLIYTIKLTDAMIEEIINNNGEVWLYIMSGWYDIISNRTGGTTDNGIPGRIYAMQLAAEIGDYTTIDISPIYTYPNYEGAIEEGSNILYKNPSIIRDIKHNLPDIADDSEINRRIIATYPTMMYLYDTAGDMADLNTTVIQNCADENRETAQELYETTMYEYNPIENYSMTEDGSHSSDGSIGITTRDNSTTTTESCEGYKEKGSNRVDNASEGSNNANGKSDSEAVKQQFGYNSKNPSDVEKSLSKADTANNSKSLSRDGSVGNSNSESRAHGKSEVINHSDGKDDRINHENGETHLTRKGNIGVTTTQQMIQQEREVILDVLDWYVAKFIKCFKWGVI